MLYPFKLNGISRSYPLDHVISIVRFVGGCFFPSILIEDTVSKQWRPDQTPYSAASNLGLHCLHMFHKRMRCLFGLTLAC